MTHESLIMTDINYDLDDFLLINKEGQIVGVSGNFEFWDCEESMPPIDEKEDSYLIVKVIKYNVV